MPKKHVPIRKGGPRAHNSTLKSKTRLKDRPPMVGHEERLASYKKDALALKREGYYHHEIAAHIAKKYDLESIPAITTVANWLKDSIDAIARDIQELQWQMRIDQFQQLERLKSKWMLVATADELEIRRWQMVEGEQQPVMDENALKEQIEATKQIVAIMNRQAKLLGLDMDKAIAEAGDGPQSLQELQLWMIGQVNIVTGAPNGKAIDVQSERLELRAGLAEIDQDTNEV